MPIRLNLLAEQLAAEEARRRDPVKRAVWIAGGVVSVFVIWSIGLQVKSMGVKSELTAEQARLKSLDKGAKAAAENLKRTAEVERKLAALQSVAVNRYLWAPALDALQRVAVDNVQLVRFKGDQGYSTVTGKLSEREREKNPKAKPPTFAQERIALTIEAKDFANPSELNYNRFISAIAATETIGKALDKTDGIVLKERQQPVPDPADPRRHFILFSIECKYPDKQRSL